MHYSSWCWVFFNFLQFCIRKNTCRVVSCPNLKTWKKMLGSWGLQGPRRVHGKALVRGPEGFWSPEAPGFTLFWRPMIHFHSVSRLPCFPAKECTWRGWRNDIRWWKCRGFFFDLSSLNTLYKRWNTIKF